MNYVASDDVSLDKTIVISHVSLVSLPSAGRGQDLIHGACNEETSDMGEIIVTPALAFACARTCTTCQYSISIAEASSAASFIKIDDSGPSQRWMKPSGPDSSGRVTCHLVEDGAT